MANLPLELKTMRSLASGRPLLQCQPGEVIFRNGDPGDCLYGVVSGEVKISWGDDDHQSEVIRPGSSFGVGALVDPHHERFGTATALSECELIKMNREEFLLAVQELPMFGLEMIHDLDERLRDLKARSI
jgi:CRP-like cAMP-binding protein